MKTTIYLHSNKESNWEKGEEIGLSEKVIKENFRYALYEVPFNIEVNEDGTYKILSIEHDSKTYALTEIQPTKELG